MSKKVRYGADDLTAIAERIYDCAFKLRGMVAPEHEAAAELMINKIVDDLARLDTRRVQLTERRARNKKVYADVGNLLGKAVPKPSQPAKPTIDR